ncbi:MAG: hypothetical protein V4548_08760 [Bacteroidota bacterium]
MKTKLLLLGMCMAVFAISCNKDDETTVNQGGSDLVANQKVDSAIDDVSAIADDQYEVNEGTPTGRDGTYPTTLPDCAIVTHANASNTTITFGTATAGCMFRGHLLKGKVILTRTVTTTFPKVMTITYDGFYIDGNKLEGEATWTRSLIDAGTPNMRIKTVFAMHNITLITPNGNYVRNGDRTRIMSHGFTTYGDFSDDEFITYGSFTTVHPNGDEYVSYISQTYPLLNKVSCGAALARFPVSGILILQKTSGGATHSVKLDYGTGVNASECDDKAMMSIDQGTAVEITL